MSLSTQTTKRLPQIKHGFIKGINYTQIGLKCGVTEKTIDRDVKAWVQSGEFEVWVKEEWVRLHNIILHEDPTEAYKQITKIMSKLMVQKREVTQSVDIKETIEHVSINVTEDEELIIRKARVILRRERESQSIH